MNASMRVTARRHLALRFLLRRPNSIYGADHAIPSMHYKAHELRVYTQQDFPLHRDPYASGERRFSAVVAIDEVPPGVEAAKRYSLDCTAVSPHTAAIAAARAMQFGKDIIDGKVLAEKL